ncbi:hypothetical protein AHiyo8_49890 [Arthrobacter sp. Hiyo8]|nr:hypothetical protein AHiyo8_49890 [Arthrobacter sp. Hiyo8]
MPNDVVVGENPGGRSTGCRGLAEVLGDNRAELFGVEIGLEEVEVERLAQSFGAGVAGAPVRVDPRFGDGRPGGLYSLKTLRHSA